MNGAGDPPERATDRLEPAAKGAEIDNVARHGDGSVRYRLQEVLVPTESSRLSGCLTGPQA